MEHTDLDNVTFEGLPKNMRHLESKSSGVSKTFVVLMIAIIILFGAFWFFVVRNAGASITISTDSTQHSKQPVVAERQDTPNVGTIENDLSATVIGDYSSLFSQ